MISASNEIVAHRGLHGELPENSLPAMMAAWDHSINWCECDVQLSSDGVPVIIHDETLDRTTIGKGRVADFPAEELRKLQLKRADGKVTEHRLPLLDELLEASGPGRRLLVETKPVMGKRIYPIAKKIQKKGGMLHSFHREDMILALKATMNRCPVAVLIETAEGQISNDYGGGFHVHHEAISPLAMRVLQGYGRLGAWTVNDPQKIRELAEMGIFELIITDIPLIAKQIVDAPLVEQMRRAQAQKMADYKRITGK
jgi:glycerophosphoryl diester phosphodiesterase